MPCYRVPMKDGGHMVMCGDLGDHCSNENCSDVSGFLCDYPVGEGKTCDLPLCASHAYEIAPNLHYCAAHFAMWVSFTEQGKVEEALSNVKSLNIQAFTDQIKNLNSENKKLKERILELEKPRPIK